MEQLTESEKINLGTTEIAKRIRQQLKEEFKGCKFSVISEYYSMGSSITIALMEANFKVVKDFSDIQEEALQEYSSGRSFEQLKSMQEDKYQQLNQYVLRKEFDPRSWCNGVFLTEKGHDLLKRVVAISDYYNYDNSDSMTDYYDVNFSFSIALGKWDKPLKEVD